MEEHKKNMEIQREQWIEHYEKAVDKIWEKYDKDNSGFLEKEEAKRYAMDSWKKF